jgi:23S rRNA (cytosine1962-C5)-methyltransferase
VPGYIQLKLSADHRLRNFYPWAYRADIESVHDDPQPGEIVTVRDARGRFAAQGFYNARSHIPLRVLSLDPAPIDESFFRARIRAAAARRAGRIANTNAWRVLNGESDQLPGLVVDRFGGVLVAQIRNAGMERRRDEIIRLLAEETQSQGIYERSDVDARQDEGLEPRTGVVWGEVPTVVEVVEDDLRFEVSLSEGQKTGFYLDQRDNRRRLRALVGPGDRVLDVYSYVGSFGLHAARAGATVLCVDKDTAALALAERAARRNDVWPRMGVRWGDAIEVMSSLGEEQRSFSHIVLDPPALIKRKEDLPRTRRLFVEMCARALALLEPLGTLFLSSCAFYVGVPDLLDAARIAAGETRRRVEVLDVTYQPADHPWILQAPETLYLKTIIMRVE